MGRILSWLEVDMFPRDIVAALAAPIWQVKVNMGRWSIGLSNWLRLC